MVTLGIVAVCGAASYGLINKGLKGMKSVSPEEVKRQREEISRRQVEKMYARQASKGE